MCSLSCFQSRKYMQPLLEQKWNTCRIPHYWRWYMISIQRFFQFFFQRALAGIKETLSVLDKNQYYHTSWDNHYLSHSSTQMTANFNPIARDIALAPFWMKSVIWLIIRPITQVSHKCSNGTYDRQAMFKKKK